MFQASQAIKGRKWSQVTVYRGLYQRRLFTSNTVKLAPGLDVDQPPLGLMHPKGHNYILYGFPLNKTVYSLVLYLRYFYGFTVSAKLYLVFDIFEIEITGY